MVVNETYQESLPSWNLYSSEGREKKKRVSLDYYKGGGMCYKRKGEQANGNGHQSEERWWGCQLK